MQESAVSGSVFGPFQEMWTKVLNYVPSLLAGLLILMLGLAVCWLTKKAVMRLVILMRLDRALRTTRWARAMSQADVRHAVASAAGNSWTTRRWSGSSTYWPSSSAGWSPTCPSCSSGPSC